MAAMEPYQRIFVFMVKVSNFRLKCQELSTTVNTRSNSLQISIGQASCVGGIMGSEANPIRISIMRTLNRPMFRTGGSAGTGITSGLAPRQGYQTARQKVMSPAEKNF